MNFKIYGGLTLQQIQTLFLAEVTDYIVNVCNDKDPERVTNYMASQWPLIEQYLVSGRGLDARASDLTCSFGTRFTRI
jgi:hypothetical protein